MSIANISLPLTGTNTIKDISTSAPDKEKTGFSAWAHNLCKTIANIFSKTNNEIPHLVRLANENTGEVVTNSGKGLEKDGKEKIILSGFRIALKDAAKGVRGGFMMTKTWNDVRDLRESTNRFAVIARNWMSNQLTEGKYMAETKKFFQEGLNSLISRSKPGIREELLKIREQVNNDNFESLTPKIKDEVFKERCSTFNANNDSIILSGIKEEIHAIEPEFNKELNIELPKFKDVNFSGKYQILKAKITGKTFTLLDTAYMLDNKNRGLLTILAREQKIKNTLTKEFGLRTQGLEIIQFGASSNPLQITHHTRPENITNFDENKNEFADGSISKKHGVLVQRAPDGTAKLCKSIKDLGSSMAPMLFLGVKNPLTNNGFVKDGGKNHFFFSESKDIINSKMLSKPIGLNSDFSLNSTSKKDYSIFNQCKFSEKMRGLLQIKMSKDMRNKETGSTILENSEIKKSYDTRRQEMFKPFESRLAVQHFNFGTGIDKNSACDNTYDLLDGLEKLTSKTVGTANGEKNGVRLDIPQLREPKDRKVWDVAQGKGETQIKFTFKGSLQENKEILKTLQQYKQAHAATTAYTIDDSQADSVTILVEGENIAQAQEALSYGKIMDYKHPPTLKSWTPENDKNLLQSGNKIHEFALNWLEKKVETDAAGLDGKILNALKSGVEMYIARNQLDKNIERPEGDIFYKKNGEKTEIIRLPVNEEENTKYQAALAEQKKNLEPFQSILNLSAETSQPSPLDHLDSTAKEKVLEYTLMRIVNNTDSFVKMPFQELKDEVRKSMPEFSE